MECTDPNGCTLDGSELAERVNAWRDVSSKATTRRIEPTKITSEYPPEPLLTQRLKDLIAAEASCCSFLEFDLREERDRTVVELEFPEDARALVEGIIAPRVELLEDSALEYRRNEVTRPGDIEGR